MLVLTRKVGQRIQIGENIWISVEEIDRGKVRIGIEAPKTVAILREEVAEMTDPIETLWGTVKFDNMGEER